MSKKSGLGKFILFCTAVGAAAAGAYYYLTKREAEIADGLDDDDFDDYDFDDDLDDGKDSVGSSRKYVDIKSGSSASSENASDTSSDDEDKEAESGSPDSTEEFFDDEDEDDEK